MLHVNELRVFGAKAFPLLALLMHSIGTTFTVLSYEAVWAENRGRA